MNQHVDPTALRVDRTPPRNDGPIEAERPNVQPPKAETKDGDRPRKGRPLKPILIGTALVAGLGAGGHFGWDYWTVGRFQESTDDAYVKADSTILAPKVSGQLAAVLVGDNEVVKQGQPLARIDDRDFQAALKQAEANVSAAEATIANTRAAIDQQGAVVAQARASVDLDGANLTFADQESTRFVTLASRGAGTVQNAQQATSRLDAAKATLGRDKAAVEASELQTKVLRAQLAHSEAELLHDQAVVEQARLNLSYATIVAPIDGVVGDRTLRVGQYVQAGTALLGVVPLQAVYVVANFKETQLTRMRQGQPVAIVVDGFPDHIVRGAIDSLAPASGQEFALLPPDNATGNFTKIVQRVPVRITLDPKDPLIGLLRPGMSVVPTVTVETRS